MKTIIQTKVMVCTGDYGKGI